MNRRQFLFSLSALALAAGLPGGLAWAQAAAPAEHVLGSPDAPVTIIEYASLTCPHCAAFHAETLPTLKKEWIEPGKAKLIFKHFPLDRLALRAATVANCMPNDKAFFAFMDLLFSQQRQWATASDPDAALRRLAAMAGLPDDRYAACASNEEQQQAILKGMQEAGENLGVNSTPTFFVNGRKINGAAPYEKFNEVLTEAAGS